MANDNEKTGFTVEGDVNPFQAAMRRLVDSAKDGQSGVGQALGDLTNPLNALQKGFAALAAVVSIAFFKDTIAETAEMTEEVTNLARQFGTTGIEAQAYRLALAGMDGEQADFVAAGRGMAKQLKENEDQMNAMGLKTRDASGNLRPLNDLVVDGISVLNGYKEGTDRAMASAVVFGKGVDTQSRLFLLNQDAVESARKTMEDYDLQIGEKSVAAYEEFDQAGDTAQAAVMGIKKAIGDALMPVATDLVNLFNSAAPYAITVLRGALGGLMATFYAVKNGVVVLWEAINAMVISVAEPIRALAEAIGKALTGDFKGAGAAIKGIGSNIADAWSSAMDKMTASSQATATRISNLFTKDTVAAPSQTPGDKNYKAPPEKPEKVKKVKVEPEPSRMGQYEIALNEKKLAYERENSMREFNKGQELEYWQGLLGQQNLYAKDREAIALKVSKMEVQILRDNAKEQGQIHALRQEDAAQATASYIEELRARSQTERDIGLITNAEYLARQATFNQARMQGELDLVQQRIAAAALDPEKNVVALEQLELQKLEIRRRYAALGADVAREQTIEQARPMMTVMDTIQQSMGGLTNTLLTNWKGLGTALRGVLQGIGLSIIQETVTKPLMAKVAAFAKEKLLAMANIGTSAAEAGAGAAASQAGIPIIGPGLALAAMAAVFAAVGGMAGSVPSASAGFDIPSGLNPLTQLHEEEMVLPADLSNTIRSMAQGGGSAGGEGGGRAMSIRGMPPGEWLMVHRSDLVKALGASQRDFNFRGA